jgi:hypothetical protein
MRGGLEIEANLSRIDPARGKNSTNVHFNPVHWIMEPKGLLMFNLSRSPAEELDSE